jgi:hypothetical protein
MSGNRRRDLAEKPSSRRLSVDLAVIRPDSARTAGAAQVGNKRCCARSAVLMDHDPSQLASGPGDLLRPARFTKLHREVQQ